MFDPEGKISRHTTFDVINVQGGGIFEVESDSGGLYVSCNQLIVNSGGKFHATKLDLTANLVKIDQSGILEANYEAKVMIVVMCCQATKYIQPVIKTRDCEISLCENVWLGLVIT